MKSVISPRAEKRMLQGVVVIACLIPLSAGLAGALRGPDLLGSGNINLDSHFRYLSGLLLGIGVCFLSAVPDIERKGARVRMLTLIVFIGGLARLLGFLLAGLPGHGMIAAAVMELICTPLICLWQYRVARRFNSQ